MNPHLAAVLLSGLAFAVPAMGRFVYTPILPLMQAEYGVSIVAAGWLAAANHIGYLLGALTAARAPFTERRTMRIGLAGVAAGIAAMAFTGSTAVWFTLRLLAGVAAAWVLIHTSAWGLRNALAAGRPQWSGLVFAGSGLGVVLSGVLCAVCIVLGGGADGAWLASGVLVALLGAVLWPRVGEPVKHHAPAAGASATGGIPRDIGAFVVAYGLCGFGYVTAATFLPVLARTVLGGGHAYAWFWPVFGVAAMVSTLLAARLGARFGDLAAFRGAAILMAVGNAAMAVLSDAWALAFGTVAVGGTFMVLTMLGLREARRRAPQAATRVIGRMTIAWAVGQVAGPVVSGYLAGAQGGFGAALWVAGVALAVAVTLTPGKAAV